MEVLSGELQATPHAIGHVVPVYTVDEERIGELSIEACPSEMFTVPRLLVRSQLNDKHMPRAPEHVCPFQSWQMTSASRLLMSQPTSLLQGRI
jgi:hypothetical protein